MNNYFCVLPFYGAEFSPGQPITPCCLLPANTNINELRQSILSKQRHPACLSCWRLEDQNKLSNRQILNQTFDYYTDKDIQFIEEECKTGNFTTQIVKLYTSNLCNGTCIVCCDDDYSTAWSTLNGKTVFKILDNSELVNIDYSNIKILSFVGGEPLYEKKNIEVLEKLISKNNTNCFISMVTNGAIQLSDEYLNILTQFKNLNFCLSIDGIGPVFEYLRYPLKWDTLLHNINTYKQLGINLSVSYTISNLNIFYHKQTVEWFESTGLNYNFNLVTHPVYFSPNALPKTIKDSLIEVTDFFDKHTNEDEINFQLAVKELRRQDQLKRISIQDYLPELTGWFR